MTQFPELRPSSRNFVVGELPVSTFTAISGKETRVILGDTFSKHVLSLGFQNILDSAGKKIIDHWYGQQGTALGFTLPASIYAGWSEYASAITPGQLWRYEGKPTVSSIAPGIMSMSVQLVSLA